MAWFLIRQETHLHGVVINEARDFLMAWRLIKQETHLHGVVIKHRYKFNFTFT